MMIVHSIEHAEMNDASIHALIQIHAVMGPSVMLKIINQFVNAQAVLLEVH